MAGDEQEAYDCVRLALRAMERLAAEESHGRDLLQRGAMVRATAPYIGLLLLGGGCDHGERPLRLTRGRAVPRGYHRRRPWAC